MSKRRRKKAPNIPQATLDRARTETNGEDASPTSERATARRQKVSAARLERTRRTVKRDGDKMDNEMIQQLLDNPTVEVSDEAMHEEYRHVLVDLRNMGVLAAALMVLLVILAQFI